MYPTGIVFADRHTEVNGDYKTLAFLSYRSLELEIYKDCLKDLAEEITRTASTFQAQRGQQFRISMCGQTVTLGAA